MLECKDCCLYETDACRYGRYALEHNMSIQCDDFIVEHNKAYQQGKAEAIDEMKALIYQFDDYCNERECKYCWMNVSDDYSCLKQWINSKFEELKENL